MPGLFDNEHQHFVCLPEIEQGEWYLDADRQLYIIPLDGDSHGPDNEIMDALEAAYRTDTPLSEYDMEQMGLQPVLPVLKRFCPRRGWHVA